MLHEDRRGTLWIGTLGGGLNKFIPSTSTALSTGSAQGPDRETDRFIRYRHDPNRPNSLSSDWILSLHESRFTNYRREPLDPNSLNDSDIWAVFEDHAGILWVGTESGGLNRIDPQTATFTHYTHDPNNPKGMPPV